MDLRHLLARARRLADSATPARRRLLGITGPPGAGKSTLAAHLVAELSGRAALVPMDGFHLAGAELRRLGRTDRKGAPDTFDPAGYAALLTRLRSPEPDTSVYAPAFDRRIEEPVAGSIPVAPHIPLIVTEGNYLLLDSTPGTGYAPCSTRSGTSSWTPRNASAAWSTAMSASGARAPTPSSSSTPRTRPTPASWRPRATAPTSSSPSPPARPRPH